MTSEVLVVQLDADVVECGDVVSGWIGAGVGAAEVVLIGTVTRVDGGGKPAQRRLAARTLGEDQGRVRFEAGVPSDGPLTFSGVLVTASWELAVLAADGRVVTALPVVVLPAGGAAVWARRAAPPPEPHG